MRVGVVSDSDSGTSKVHQSAKMRRASAVARHWEEAEAFVSVGRLLTAWERRDIKPASISEFLPVTYRQPYLHESMGTFVNR